MFWLFFILVFMSCCDNGRGEDNCGLYLMAVCITYFSSKLRLVFEGGLYLNAASIPENAVSIHRSPRKTLPRPFFFQNLFVAIFSLLYYNLLSVFSLLSSICLWVLTQSNIFLAVRSIKANKNLMFDNIFRTQSNRKH